MMLRGVGRRVGVAVTAPPLALRALQVRCVAQAAQLGGRYGMQGNVKTMYDISEWEDEITGRSVRRPFSLSITLRASINRTRQRLGLPPVLNWKLFTSEAIKVREEWMGIDDPRAQEQLARERKSKVGSSTTAREGLYGGGVSEQRLNAQGSSMSRPQPRQSHPISRVMQSKEHADAIALARLVQESNRHSVYEALKACGKACAGPNSVQYLPRPPIVTIIGHVDHGKTTLLDCLRRSNVAGQEAGGITQSIGAFRVFVPGCDHSVTFIDTPGHEAFGSMRRAGCSATDVVVLVVSGVEGVQQQTVECAKLVTSANLPCVVAITKRDRCDQTGEDAEAVNTRIGAQLQQYGLQTEAMGGDVMSVSVSSTQGTGIDELLEAINLQAELLELRTPVPCRAEACVLESHSRTDTSPAAVNCIVRRGVLKVGANVIGGQHFVKVTSMRDEGGNSIKEAGPGQPVAIHGFVGSALPSPNSTVVEAGQRVSRGEWARFVAFFMHAKTAKSEWYEALEKERRMLFWETRPDIPDEALPEHQRRDQTQQLRVILKASTRGMLDAMEQAVAAVPKLAEVSVRVVYKGIGDVDDNDGQIFNHRPNETIVLGCGVQDSSMSDWGENPPQCSEIIYRITDALKERLVSFLPKRRVDDVLGEATVQDVFKFSGVKTSNVGGLYINSGELHHKHSTKVVRGANEVFRGGAGCVVSLRHVKEEVVSMKSGSECGIILDDFFFQAGDTLVQFEEREEAPTVDEVFGAM
eukprot:TRINITY_DN5192_c0_g1_i1.p1 TRINITY_DN5192_c0_g1~~TRINITY_DN5192_c0_g1_i1.p1  ORF type:complete len:752 (+),score=247.73 TRINITY_DN5192_c0_g1_i1:59-2314(+)